MISVKEAVGKAVEFAQTVLEPPRNSHILLEEVETGESNGEEIWFITLSMPRPNLLASPFGPREYKTFTVHGATGQVLAMKIRELAGAQ